jgi:hypothetical protein
MMNSLEFRDFKDAMKAILEAKRIAMHYDEGLRKAELIIQEAVYYKYGDDCLRQLKQLEQKY